MPTYKLNRNYLLHSKFGHTIHFKKGEPTNVPQICAREVVAIGAELLEGDVVEVLDDEPVIVNKTHEERLSDLFKAFDVMMERDQRGDFTAQGIPNLFALNKMLDFEVDAKERDSAWEQYRISKEEE